MKPCVLIVDDEPAYRALYAGALQAAGFETAEAGSAAAAMELIRNDPPAMVVSDVRMPGSDGLDLLKDTRTMLPDLPFLLVTAYADVRDAVAALKLGAVDYMAKPVDLDELVTAAHDALGTAGGRFDADIPDEIRQGIVAESPAMRAVLRDAGLAARSDATVLLLGESGTGKEVIARAIHRASHRGDGPFIAVNCGAVAPTLLASELFGHAKGAFTGATADRKGYFRAAEKGTLFLDEITDMPFELQSSLLRAIETRQIMPVGGSREIPADFRLLAATNRDLDKAVEQGRFREDLFYRINVVALHLPPLRERGADILPLARQFLGGRSADRPRTLSAAAADLLTAHTWPGNVRELVNAMERAAVLGEGGMILPEHLPGSIRRGTAPAPEPGGSVPTLQQTEIETIRKALAATDNNRTKAAELLGITRRGLIYKLKRFGI